MSKCKKLKISVLWNEAKVNKSHALTTLDWENSLNFWQVQVHLDPQNKVTKSAVEDRWFQLQ